jgi:hypothetical protein
MAQQTSTAIASAIAIQTIGGVPAVEMQQTIFAIGEETLAAEILMAKGEEARAILDQNLFDIVKGLPFVEFSLVRDFHKAGAIDKGKTDDAAQKIWERQIKRLGNTFDFVIPKSESKDAVRKAAAKAAEIAKLAEFDDDDLETRKAELLTKGDDKSCTMVKKINAELEAGKKAKELADSFGSATTSLSTASSRLQALIDSITNKINLKTAAGEFNPTGYNLPGLQQLFPPAQGPLGGIDYTVPMGSGNPVYAPGTSNTPMSYADVRLTIDVAQSGDQFAQLIADSVQVAQRSGYSTTSAGSLN